MVQGLERVVLVVLFVPVSVWLIVLTTQPSVGLTKPPVGLTKTPVNPTNGVDILMVTIPREPSYLNATLESLTQVSGARIVLFNAAHSYENHTRLLPWCNTFLCVPVPTTPPYDIQQALFWKTKTPSNGLDYLTWRTKQNHAVRYALTWIMTHQPSKHIIVIEDDVIVQSDITSFVPDTVSCLRQGTVYCGAVAYLFERHFVWTVLRQLYRDIHKQPIDFIFERAAGGRQNVARQSFVRHNGKISSSPERHRRYIKD
jgi:hypothetical protein